MPSSAYVVGAQQQNRCFCGTAVIDLSAWLLSNEATPGQKFVFCLLLSVVLRTCALHYKCAAAEAFLSQCDVFGTKKKENITVHLSQLSAVVFVGF